MKTGLVIAVPALLLVALLAGCDNGDSQSQAAVGTAAVIDPVGGAPAGGAPAATPTQPEITAAARAALAAMQSPDAAAAPPSGETASNLLPAMPTAQGSNLLPSMRPPQPMPMPAPIADNTAPADAFWRPAPAATPAASPAASAPSASFWPSAPAAAADATAPAAPAANAPAEPAPADATIPYPLPLPPTIREAEHAGEPQGDAPAEAGLAPLTPVTPPSTPEKPADSAAGPPPAPAPATPPPPPAGASPATPPAGAAPSGSPTAAAPAPAPAPWAPSTAATPPSPPTPAAPAAPPDFYHADTNFDARIEFDEAQKIWPQLTRKQFDAADLDGSGSLNGDEYALVVKHPPK